ncbi:hypothetical protein ACTL6U_19855 [Rhodovibrionaceae bacterium A322]
MSELNNKNNRAANSPTAGGQTATSRASHWEGTWNDGPLGRPFVMASLSLLSLTLLLTLLLVG